MVPTFPEFPPMVITADDLVSLGDSWKPQTLHAIAKTVWRDLQAGKTLGKKSVLYPRQADLWRKRKYASLRHALGDERLGWKLSALSSVGRDHAAVKIVGANALNRHLGLERSASTILLMDKASMRPLCIMEGTGISAARTGTYASIVAETWFAKQERLEVFIFGGGPIARSLCLTLASVRGETIDAIWVKTRSARSAHAFANSLRAAAMTITPVADNSALASADLVITASNSNTPLFSPAELKNDAVVFHLGGDETPSDYLAGMLRLGNLACDDIAMVSARGSSSLALYFSRRNTSLEMQAPLLAIESLAAIVNGEIRPARPSHITCVGLPSLDLYVARHVYETLLARSSSLPQPSQIG